MSEYVWLLKKFRWDGDDVLAAFSTSKDARETMARIKAEASKHRVEHDALHDLEMNLYTEKWNLRPAGDESFTFAQAVAS